LKPTALTSGPNEAVRPNLFAKEPGFLARFGGFTISLDALSGSLLFSGTFTVSFAFLSPVAGLFGESAIAGTPVFVTGRSVEAVTSSSLVLVLFIGSFPGRTGFLIRVTGRDLSDAVCCFFSRLFIFSFFSVSGLMPGLCGSLFP
jgi:hypothetical protein